MAAGSPCSLAGPRDGGFYKCEECSKSFNRMASYEAHIRIHALEELDILDVVFNCTASGYEDPTERKDARNKSTKSHSPSPKSATKSPLPEPTLSAGIISSRTPVDGNRAFRLVELLLTDTRRSGASVAPINTRVDVASTATRSSFSGHELGVVPTLQSTSKDIAPSENEGGGAEHLMVKIPRKFCSVGDSDSTSVSSSQSSPQPSPQPSKKKVVRLDSLDLPKTSDTENRSCDESPLTKVQGRLPSLMKKRRRVLTSSRFKCHICHRLLSSNSALKRHNLLHTGERPFKCSICDKTFTQPHHRDNHELTHFLVRQLPDEGGSADGKFVKCHGGSNVSSSLSSTSPIRNQHFYKCKVCGMIFVGLVSFKAHITTHDTKRPFQCDVCGMRFVRKVHLEVHVQTHVEKNCKCAFCDKQFNQTRSLDRHLLLHIRGDTYTSPTPREKYKCKYCTKLCHSLSGLTRHQDWHLSPKKKPKPPPVSETGCNQRHVEDEKSLMPGSEDGEVLSRYAHVMERKMLPSLPEDDEVFTSDLEDESKSPSLRANRDGVQSNDLELELDSASEDEEDQSPSPLDTETEGELADVSNNDSTTTTEESTDDSLESDEQSKSCDGRRGVEVSGDESESEMSPLRLDTDEESSEDAGEKEGMEEEEDFMHFIQCNGEVGVSRSNGRNPHNHKKGKGGTPQYKCEWCGRLFLRRDYLRQHYFLHQQVPHQCHLCGKVFMSRRYINRHLHTAHR